MDAAPAWRFVRPIADVAGNGRQRELTVFDEVESLCHNHEHRAIEIRETLVAINRAHHGRNGVLNHRIPRCRMRRRATGALLDSGSSSAPMIPSWRNTGTPSEWSPAYE